MNRGGEEGEDGKEREEGVEGGEGEERGVRGRECVDLSVVFGQHGNGFGQVDELPVQLVVDDLELGGLALREEGMRTERGMMRDEEEGESGWTRGWE